MESSAALVSLSFRFKPVLLGSLMFLLTGPGGHAEKAGSVPARRGTSGASLRHTTPGGLGGLALPDPFLQRIDDRLAIDAYQFTHHTVAPGIIPTPRPRYIAPSRVSQLIRTVRVDLPADAVAYRSTNTEWALPPRGFRPPILDQVAEPWPIRVPTESLSAGERAAASLVERRLSSDGLLPTLARILTVLGPAQCQTNAVATLARLVQVGYPADLLQHFRWNDVPADRPRPLTIIEALSRRLAGAPNPEAIADEPLPVTFDYQPFRQGVDSASRLSVRIAAPERSNASGNAGTGGRFQLAMESGEHEVGLVRMQVGGGWRDGVVPGGSIDLIGQMADHFRTANFLLSVDRDASVDFQSLITNTWRLRRPQQITLCEELVTPSAWAQDNGKAGLISGGQGEPGRPATLLPRYACVDEGKSVFAPAESYLADGLRAAGHAVVHSPLLFQGGNLLGVRDPQSGRRLLVLGDGTIYRNISLGLSRPQVLAAFQAEFGVDDVVVLPGVSYHLDFDVTFRSTGGNWIAFVNDTPAAARQIVALGIATLRRHELLPGAEADRIQTALDGGQAAEVVSALRRFLGAQRGPDATNAYPASLSRAFVSDPVDDATGNLQVFLVAVDLLESTLPAPRPAPGAADERQAYLGALRRMEAARAAQADAIRRMGCRVMPVPSMQDLHRSLNALNGIQHRDGYILPAYGGFYASVDQAAAAIFRQNLPPGALVTLFRTAECQRRHGAVHCTASVFPRL